MKFYIAARFSRRHELRPVVQVLVEMGHEVTSRWITDDSHVTGSDETCAMVDFADVYRADFLLSFNEEARSNSRGGRHVEFGLAMGMGKPVGMIGEPEHVFHHLHWVIRFKTLDEFLQFARDA